MYNIVSGKCSLVGTIPVTIDFLYKDDTCECTLKASCAFCYSVMITVVHLRAPDSRILLDPACSPVFVGIAESC